MDILRAKDIYFKYGEETVLTGVSMEVKKGEVVGVLGNNGEGKSTLLSIFATLLPPSRGEVQYLSNGEAETSLPELRKKIGYVPQEMALYINDSPYQNLKTFGRLHGLTKKRLKEKTEELAGLLNLEEGLHKPVKKLSGGMKRRVNLAVALIHEPPLLILDEPTAGIDFASRRAILKVLKGLAEKGGAIVYSTHAPEEVQYICTRAYILEEGKIRRRLTMKEEKGGIMDHRTLEEVLSPWFINEKEEG